MHLWLRYGSNTRRGKRGQNTPVICTLDRKNLETCYNAIQQLCLQAKPHIFVYTEVFVAVFIFHRSHGEETNIALAKLINARSGGKIDVTIYPSGQMGNTTEFSQGVIDGTIDIGSGMTTDLVDFIPQNAVFDMPNLFPDIETMRKVLKGEFADTMNEYNQAGGVMMLGYADAGFRQLTTNKEVRTLSDLKGQNIRVMTNPYHIAYWNALGANAVSMEFTEVFMGLQQGTIDGQENPYMNIVTNNVQEVQKYVVETNHVGHIITFFMNNALYQSLPDDVKALVDECAADAVSYGNEIADESIAAYKQTCIDAGCEIITLDESVMADLKEKANIVYDMVRKNLGDEIVDQVFEAVAAQEQ